MKAKVLVAFRDRCTKETYTKDQIIDVTGERFEEINSSRFGVLVEAVAVAEEVQEKPKQELESESESKKPKPKTATKKPTKKK